MFTLIEMCVLVPRKESKSNKNKTELEVGK